MKTAVQLTLLITTALLLWSCDKDNIFDTNNIYTDKEIRNRMEDNLDSSCYDNMSRYPRVIGKHAKNGRTLEEICFCSDYCPKEFWYVAIRYEGISTKEECAEIGGRDMIDPAWGGYIGCAPIVD